MAFTASLESIIPILLIILTGYALEKRHYLAVMLFASAGCKEKTKTDTGSKKPSSSQNSGADSVSSDSSDSSDQSSDVSSDGTLSTDSRGNLSDDITSSD